ncbi:MAG: 2-oxoglutarate dehydrogenase complex dihydrolipoyllysine-residue succinyltransferase [Deltaproteobacteria bacterium]|jgi:2-oxoglutarate dehydrogenase E2 component (dihydrolipoamide succinyltransferase)|nr:2-oxoglutarate dehydrogenase complex dihydrolipoyllysine-residue succinyltransferase [Deltaproteobacteria bacterium]MBW2534263.1 2-oxoglutarate dehydrogenase complex dihydrolipoyllysine-residue succinyltransferase [Deltaproteobacteria bacterium]
MLHEIKIPELGESVTEGVIGAWLHEDGETVAEGEPVMDLETDKVSMQVVAPASGRLFIKVEAGETVRIGQVVATVDDSGASAIPKPLAPAPAASPAAPAPAAPAPAADPPLVPPAGMPQAAAKLAGAIGPDTPLSPAVRRVVAEHQVDPATVEPTGPHGRLTKGDVLRHVDQHPAVAKPAPAPVVAAAPPAPSPTTPAPPPAPADGGPRQTRRRMSQLRQRIAERLVMAQQQAAMLTTFNEADMSRAMAWRAEHKEAFEKRYGVRLGFMSFFVKAAVDALATVPGLNSFIDGDELVQNHFYDIGVAVSTERGLMVPVIRDCDRLSFADIERAIADYAQRARDRTITLDELAGGCFTISNGGVFGSLLSTPILNPPQAGILGLHAIKKRPVVVDDEIVVRPMMYLAMSYDHRIVDGREAVTFLRRIVDCIEHPERMMLEV